MRTCEGLFQIITPTMTEEFKLINQGGNHCQISNTSHVLYDGDILRGYKIFEDKAKEQEMLANFVGWTFKRIK